MVEKKPMKKTPPSKPGTATVRMDDNLRAEAKSYAAKQRLKLVDLINEAVSEYLKKRGA